MAAMSASNTTTQDLPCHITLVAGPATHAQREAWRWLWSRLLREERASRGAESPTHDEAVAGVEEGRK